MMKKNLLYIGSVLVLILAAITFVFVPGMTQAFKRGELPPFGKYDGKKIRYEAGTDFANAVSNIAENFQENSRRTGIQLTERDYFSIYNYAFNAVIESLACAGAVEKANFFPSEKKISRELAKVYSDETGQFSRKVFNSVSDSDRAKIRKDTIRNLKIERFRNDCYGYKISEENFMGIKTSPNEAQFIFKMTLPSRDLDFVTFNASKCPDEKAQEFAQNNADFFTNAEVFAITVSEESKAKTILKRLQNEEITFPDAISAYSEKYYTNSEGKIENSKRYQIRRILNDSADSEKIFALKKDEFSEIIKTKDGFTIFYCENEAQDADFSTNDAISDVKTYIETYEGTLLDEYFLKIAQDFTQIAREKTFSDACSQNNTEKKSAIDIRLNYGSNSIFAPLPDSLLSFSGISTNEEFFKTIFSLEQNEISNPVKIGENFFVFQVTSISDSDSSDSMEDFENQSSQILEKFTTFDENSAQTAIFESPKIENNVSEVFFNHLMRN